MSINKYEKLKKALMRAMRDMRGGYTVETMTSKKTKSMRVIFKFNTKVSSNMVVTLFSFVRKYGVKLKFVPIGTCNHVFGVRAVLF